MPPSSDFDAQFKPPVELELAWTRHPAIVKLGENPVLRQVAKPITRYTQETRQLIERMTEVMRDAHGLGLAAPQIGVSSRIIVYDAGDGVRVLVNPVILKKSGEQDDPPEGCLSIPGLQGVVKRAQELQVQGFDERGRPVKRRAKELEARVIQHEVDHLDGILFIDRADPDTLMWMLGEDDEDGNGAPRE